MILRPALLEDAEALAHLGRISFCAAFEHLYQREDLDTFLTQSYAPDVVASQIADPKYTHRLAIEPDSEQLAGFIKMAQPSGYGEYSDASNPVALVQLYTDPARTGRGIGAALMDWALKFACDANHDAVQLSVWIENFGAQRFYQRYGFQKIADISFWVGQHRDDEFLYELKI